MGIKILWYNYYGCKSVNFINHFKVSHDLKNIESVKILQEINKK